MNIHVYSNVGFLYIRSNDNVPRFIQIWGFANKVGVKYLKRIVVMYIGRTVRVLR